MLYLLLPLALVFIYWYLTRNHNYWAKRNVKHDPPVPLFGNHYQNMFGYRTITQISIDLYYKYANEKIVGYYRGNTPELLIRDPDMVRQIMSVDFDHFYGRGIDRNPKKDPMTINMFSSDGDNWKLLRQRLTAAFTSSKLKNMYPLVVRCAEKLQIVTADLAAKGTEYDARELMARFTTEFIGACGFGVEMDSINNEQSYFRDIGQLILTRNLKGFLVLMTLELFPELKTILSARVKIVDDSIMHLFRSVRDQRGGNPSGRHDFVDLLLQLKQKGKIIGESIEHPPKQAELELTDEVIAAQLYVFFAAGFETSSASTSFLLHQLSYNPDIQAKVHEEIDRVMAKYDNKLCYEGVVEMEYLDMAFKEALRLFPSIGCLNRVCMKKYKIPGTDVEITPGVKVLIPAQALQNDPAYWDEPEKFMPERFAPSAAPRHGYVYLPFGDGPRACIGARLGQMQSLAGLAALLHRFSVKPGPSTKPKLEVHNFMNIVQGVKGGIPLIFSERKPKTT